MTFLSDFSHSIIYTILRTKPFIIHRFNCLNPQKKWKQCQYLARCVQVARGKQSGKSRLHRGSVNYSSWVWLFTKMSTPLPCTVHDIYTKNNNQEDLHWNPHVQQSSNKNSLASVVTVSGEPRRHMTTDASTPAPLVLEYHCFESGTS